MRGGGAQHEAVVRGGSTGRRGLGVTWGCLQGGRGEAVWDWKARVTCQTSVDGRVRVKRKKTVVQVKLGRVRVMLLF